MFFVIEIQKPQEGDAAYLVHQAATEQAAQVTFHTVLAAAAQSSLKCHSVVILDDEGHAVRAERYNN